MLQIEQTLANFQVVKGVWKVFDEKACAKKNYTSNA